LEQPKQEAKTKNSKNKIEVTYFELKQVEMEMIFSDFKAGR